MVSPYISPAAVHMTQADFESELLSICGDVRLLWMPLSTDSTTSTSKDRNERTVTYSKDVRTFDTPPSRLGNGYAVTFDGTDEEADTPDVGALSFGDGVVDQPFSVLSLVSGTLSANVIASKAAQNNNEWFFGITYSGKTRVEFIDVSASAQIGRTMPTPTADTWTLVSSTYDGSGVSNGIKLYQNAAQVDDGDSKSGTYTAMEPLGSTGKVGFYNNGSGVDTYFFNGSIGFVLVTAKELTAAEQWQIKILVNGFYGLSL